MHFLSFAWKHRGIVIDVGLHFLSGFILEQFPLGIKQLERRCAKLKTQSMGRSGKALPIGKQ
jgi:hypothetical protein